MSETVKKLYYSFYELVEDFILLCEKSKIVNGNQILL